YSPLLKVEKTISGTSSPVILPSQLSSSSWMTIGVIITSLGVVVAITPQEYFNVGSKAITGGWYSQVSMHGGGVPFEQMGGLGRQRPMRTGLPPTQVPPSGGAPPSA